MENGDSSVEKWCFWSDQQPPAVESCDFSIDFRCFTAVLRLFYDWSGPIRMDRRTSLSLWMCEAHNDVNQKLGKPTFVSPATFDWNARVLALFSNAKAAISMENRSNTQAVSLQNPTFSIQNRTFSVRNRTFPYEIQHFQYKIEHFQYKSKHFRTKSNIFNTKSNIFSTKSNISIQNPTFSIQNRTFSVRNRTCRKSPRQLDVQAIKYVIFITSLSVYCGFLLKLPHL